MQLPSIEAIQCELARRNYYEYVKYTHGNMFKEGHHIKFLAKTVQDFLNDKYDNQNILLLAMPPQHGKSMTITETLPSWYLGNHTGDGVIVLSYGDDLAKKFGKKNKNKIVEYGESVFGIRLAKDQQSILNFGIDGDRGFGKFAGIMAGVTGNNADLIIIDDPIKNRKEAESETYRASLKQEFEDTVLSRLSAKGKIIVIQTRWHEDDLIGHLKTTFPEKCLNINIPLEAEEDDILGREVGDALFPGIGKDKAWLEEKKKMYITESGLRSWNSLYQGRPVGLEGNVLKRKWFKFIKKNDLPGIKYDKGKVVDYFAGMITLIMSVDCTFKDSEDSDNVAIEVLGKRGPDIYVLKVLAEKLDFVSTIDAIRTVKAQFPGIQAIFIEDKANGSAVINVLSKEMSGIIPVEPYGGKVARAYAIQPTCRSGNVHVLIDSWTEPFMSEMTGFPNAKHDDMVDGFTQGANQLIYYHSEIPIPPKRDDFRDLMKRTKTEEDSDTEIDGSIFEL